MVTESSGNIYADVGFPEAEIMEAKAELVSRIADIIEERGWTQTEAAQRVGLSQPKISELLRGKFRGFAMERLLRILTQLNQDITIWATPASSCKDKGRIAVMNGERLVAAGETKLEPIKFS